MRFSELYSLFGFFGDFRLEGGRARALSINEVMLILMSVGNDALWLSLLS